MEDFVPFELAVKLKEKGFDYKCLYVYNKEQIINPEIVKTFGELSDDGYYELTKEGGGKLDWSFVYIDEYQLIQYRDVLITREMIKAPTISHVLKWLREEKEIDIILQPIFLYNENNREREYGIEIYAPQLNKPTHLNYFKNWGKGAIAGIDYVLGNLI